MKLALPLKTLEQHLVVLGKTGAGKSSVMRHLVEYLLSHKRRVCIIDPKGDWWGLKASADGKGAGFPVVTFGDFKNEQASDIPIDRHSGKEVAKLVASGNRPLVIGLRGWMPAAQAEFWIDFASTIFNSNSCGGLNLVVDEIQNFAPKERTGFDQENLALHWTKRLLSEGRGLGLSIFCGSQRPQSVHNGVLTQCETLVAMRLIHDADCSAVENWLKRTRDKEKRAEIMTTLPDLGRGEAWVWSPEAGFGPVRMQFPMFETFDSFAPQQLQKKVLKRSWFGVDLEEVKQKLASVIEQAKANDPKELQHEVARLKGELAKRDREKPAAPKIETKTKEIFVLKDGQLKRAEDLIEQARNSEKIIRDAANMLERQIGSVSKVVMPIAEAIAKTKVSTPAQPPVRLAPSRPRLAATARPAPNPSSSPSRDVTAAADEDSIVNFGAGIKRCAIAIAQRNNGATREQLTILTGLRRSTRNRYLQHLASAGLASESAGRFHISAQGMDWLGSDYESLPTGEALQRYWIQKLPGSQSDILKVVLENPEGISRDEISERTGLKRSTRNRYLQHLQAQELVLVQGEQILPAPELFEN